MKEILFVIILLSTFSCSNIYQELVSAENEATLLFQSDCINNLTFKEKVFNLNTKVKTFEGSGVEMFYIENPSSSGVLDFLPCNLPTSFHVEELPINASFSVYTYSCEMGEDCGDSRFETIVLEDIHLSEQ